MDKRAWRQRLLAERGGSAIDHAGPVAALARFLEANVPDGARVVIYDALDDEVSLTALVAAHQEPERRFALTRTPDEGHRLTLHPLRRPDRAATGTGTANPSSAAPRWPTPDVGAVLVPGLGFDRVGTRLGRGGGYYDRFLARLDPSVLRIGVTGGIIVDRLPVEEHDVAMTHLVTAGAVVPVPLAGPGADPGGPLLRTG